ncbi:hypothetical protein ABTZ03_27310 [Kitasatospora sp. NPDC096077]|uniref:hypothetical protein n=1 Tax=Kitasatospora sp. NPDC096077 TaxID=3155544 RepID=UPI00332B492C
MEPTAIPHGPTGPGTSAARLHRSARDADQGEFLREVVRAGYPRRLEAWADGYVPGTDPAHVRAEAEFLTAELATFGIRHDRAYVEIMAAYRQLMIPVEDPELGLALTRDCLVPLIVDDACGRSEVDAHRALGAVMLRGAVHPRHSRAALDSALHPPSVYTEHSFNALARYCSPELLGLHKEFYYQSFIGVVLESGFGTDVSDGIDTEYTRQRSGFCEFYATVAAVAYDCLDFVPNLRYWGATLRFWVDYLNLVNDLMSCYKEVLNGEFTSNSIHRRAVQGGLSRLDAYAYTFDRAETAHRRILAAADARQRPHVLRYLQGYVHWHATSERYRWAEFTASA